MSQPTEASSKDLDLGQFWTISNMLSLSRAVIVAPIAYLILTDGSMAWLTMWVVIGVATDWLDGQVARWTNTVSGWGKVLDPFADKVAAIGIVLALLIKGLVPVWLFAIIAGRDLLIMVGGSLLSKRMGQVAMSIWTGKVAVTVLSVLVLAAVVLAHPDIRMVLAQTTATLFVYSFVLYIFRVIAYLKTGKDTVFGQLVDAHANELTVALLAFFFWQSESLVLEAFTGVYFGVTALWFFVSLGLGAMAYKHRQRIFYPPMLHVPMVAGFVLSLYTLLEPDQDILKYGQWLVMGFICYAALLFLPAALRRFPDQEYLQGRDQT